MHIVNYRQFGEIEADEFGYGPVGRPFMSDENIYHQIDSLKKMGDYDFDTLCCAHNPCLKNGKSRLAQKLQHLEDIVGQVQLLQKQGL